MKSPTDKNLVLISIAFVALFMTIIYFGANQNTLINKVEGFIATADRRHIATNKRIDSLGENSVMYIDSTAEEIQDDLAFRFGNVYNEIRLTKENKMPDSIYIKGVKYKIQRRK